MMTEGAEFFLSTPKLITSISNLNVYRKTSNTLLRISRTKKKIKQEKRWTKYIILGIIIPPQN